MKKRGVSFYILIFLALAALGGVVFLLLRAQQPNTPAVVLPTVQPVDASAPATPESTAGVQMIAVTPATVQTVVGTLRRIDSYSRTLTVRDFWSGGGRSRTIDVRVRGDKLRLSIRSGDDSAQQEVLISGDETWVWYSDAGAVFHGEALPGSADEWQTLLTYEDMLEAPAEDILDAGYTPFGDLNCIYIRWRSGALGYVSECWIDPDTGLLMGERCYDGESLFYSMDSSAPDVTTPDESVFAAP